jgi:hypothetical protein
MPLWAKAELLGNQFTSKGALAFVVRTARMARLQRLDLARNRIKMCLDGRNTREGA